MVSGPVNRKEASQARKELKLPIRSAAGLASLLLLISVCFLPGSAAAPSQRAPANSSDRAKTQAAIDALQQWYVPETGLYRTTGWWNSANATTALANFSRIRQSKKYLPLFANTLRAAQTKPDGAPGFINDYYDDEGWWALAWIDVYDLTGNPEYLRMADSIFSDMKRGWDTDTCGGGVWWSKKTREKNAIENELFLAVAAALANRERDATERGDDLARAEKEWTWFSGTGMINGDHLINDGLDSSDPKHCTNNGRNTWTYNQGVILGALVELNRASPDPALIRTAHEIAISGISHLTDEHGVLRENGNAHTGGDVPQFKGVFVRNLVVLDRASPDPRFQAFVDLNARSAWDYDRDAANRFGFWWAGPIDHADAARQSSALDLFVAAEAMDARRASRRERAGRHLTCAKSERCRLDGFNPARKQPR